MKSDLDVINYGKRRKLDREISGIIWKDRIWEQWYSEEAMHSTLPKMNQKDYLFSCIESDPNRVMINYRGVKKFTVSEFKDLVDKYIRAFSFENLSVGDVICTVSLTTPEMYAIKYAATSLGLITCNLNVFDADIYDNSINRLMFQMSNVMPKMIFVLDLFESKVAQIVNDDKFRAVKKVILPLDYSVSGLFIEKIGIAMLAMKNRLDRKNIRHSCSLKSFLLQGDGVTTVKNVYEPGLPCNIAFTSGTTGVNKAVLLSHDANNALAHQQIVGEIGFQKGFKHLALVPPFLAFWDADIVHAALCLQLENTIELELSYDKIPKYFLQHHSEGGIWSQYLWDSILHLPENQIKEVAENLKIAVVGGERCEKNQAIAFFEKTGVVQTTGFGATEINTTFSIMHPNCRKLGVAGIPLPFNNVKIVDESGNDLTYGQAGHLYITGPCLMNGYYNRDDLTEQVLKTDENGIVWYDTKDYAVMDEDGCLTVLDRDQDAVDITYRGVTEAIKLLDINEIILKNRNVILSKLNSVDGKIFMYLSIGNGENIKRDEVICDIIETIKNNLPELCWPNVIAVMNQLPRTQMGKVAYNILNEKSKMLSAETSNDSKLVVIHLEN